MAGSQSTDRDKPTTPSGMPVTTPQTPMTDHSFTLQSVMELQRTVGELCGKIDRLIEDGKSHGAKLDEIQHQASFIKGALATSVFFVTAIIGIASWLLNAKWDTLIAALEAIKSAP